MRSEKRKRGEMASLLRCLHTTTCRCPSSCAWRPIHHLAPDTCICSSLSHARLRQTPTLAWSWCSRAAPRFHNGLPVDLRSQGGRRRRSGAGGGSHRGRRRTSEPVPHPVSALFEWSRRQYQRPGPGKQCISAVCSRKVSFPLAHCSDDTSDAESWPQTKHQSQQRRTRANTGHC